MPINANETDLDRCPANDLPLSPISFLPRAAALDAAVASQLERARALHG